jgi:hypothetical protein
MPIARFALVFPMVVGACSRTAFQGSASGRLESSGTTGTWVLDQCVCFSGERDECSTFQIDLKLDPTRKSQFFDGNVSIDCSVEGAHVHGKLALSACRAPMGK